MANRPVYVVASEKAFERINTDFQFFPGFAVVQKQKNIESLHTAFLKQHPGLKLLEISSKSKNELGIKLSAFNLTVEGKSGKSYSVEVLFQSSKVFEKGGPYEELRDKSSREAKQDPRLKNSGSLIGFKMGAKTFPLEPKTFFYNWLYIKTLATHPELIEELVQYDAFTDIEFNPAKSINCQAEAAAIFVSLYRKNLLTAALKDTDSFLKIVYHDFQPLGENPVQESLFE